MWTDLQQRVATKVVAQCPAAAKAMAGSSPDFGLGNADRVRSAPYDRHDPRRACTRRDGCRLFRMAGPWWSRADHTPRREAQTWVLPPAPHQVQAKEPE